jgi:hypothetical protein
MPKQIERNPTPTETKQLRWSPSNFDGAFGDQLVTQP